MNKFEITISNNIMIILIVQKKYLTKSLKCDIFYGADMEPYHLKKRGKKILVFPTLSGVGRKLEVYSGAILFIVIIIFLFSNLSFANSQQDRIFLGEIQSSESENNLEFIFPFSQEVEFISYKLDSPSCLIIDLLGSNIFTEQSQTYHINKYGVGYIKVVHFGESSPENPIDLIIVEFKQPKLSYSLNKVNKRKLRLLVRKSEQRKSEFSTQERFSEPQTDESSIEYESSSENINEQTGKAEELSKKTVSNTVSPLVQPIDYSPQKKGENIFVVRGTNTGWRLWFENTLIDYKPLQIAQEQVNLAQIRVRRERRNLFPMITLQGSETIGTTGVEENEYEEREYGLRIEQPVTYGGELRYKLKRALVNLDIAKKEYNRIRADYLFRVKEAYFKLLSPKLDLMNYSKLLEKARKLNSMIEKQYKEGLVTKEEHLRMESLLDQIYFQVKSRTEDLEVAKVNFKQVLNLDMDTDIEVHPELKLEKIFVDKEQCLNVAMRRRPELAINKLVVDYNQFSREIADAKKKFRISLNGFLGRKGSNYTTEPLDMENEWSIGLKVSKAFGTNTANTSLVAREAPVSLSPAGAEADTRRASFELSFMDKMDILTEEKSADIGYMKSINELSEIKDTISTEVKTSYANYKKSLYQIKSAQEQIKKQSQRLSILRSRWKAGEANLSDVLQAELRLVNQKSNYNSGLIRYYIALSNLAKACGVDSFIDLYQIGAIARLSPDEGLDIDYSSGEKILRLMEEGYGEIKEAKLRGYIMALGSGEHSKFVIINLGKDDGARKGMDFSVYRDGIRLGDIKVISLRKNSSSCVVDEEFSSRVKLGDMVKYK